MILLKNGGGDGQLMFKEWIKVGDGWVEDVVGSYRRVRLVSVGNSRLMIRKGYSILNPSQVV